MDHSEIAERGLVLLGCGKMGSALLAGWLDGGLPATAIHVIEPAPSDWLRDTGVAINGPLPESPALVLIAVKPQMMTDALPAIRGFGAGTLFVSIAAGTPIRAFEEALGNSARIVRAMPNTPAAVGQGITALIGNTHATMADLDMSEGLMRAVGQTVCLDDEGQMDAVTALSGSGPAYVFHLIEAMAQAGVAEGLPPEMAMRLARATVAGSGALVAGTEEEAEQLRINVTSPGGTTAAALGVLMDDADGLPPLLTRAIKAAADRSRELAQ